MPIEIREVIIKTTISNSSLVNENFVANKELDEFKRQVLEECKKMMSDAGKRKLINR